MLDGRKLKPRYNTSESERVRAGVVLNKYGGLDYLAPKPDGHSETNYHLGYKANPGNPQYGVSGKYNIQKKRK